MFEIFLTSAVSDDGLVGSTETSGASLDPNRQVSALVIEANDYPYGLLQFSGVIGQLPQPDVMLLPVSEAVKVLNVSCIKFNKSTENWISNESQKKKSYIEMFKWILQYFL